MKTFSIIFLGESSSVESFFICRYNEMQMRKGIEIKCRRAFRELEFLKGELKMNNADVLSYMTNQYNSLTKMSKKVADYIFANKVETQFMSITTLAEECGVAESTVFRFCRAMGFDGYNAFKLALAKSSAASVNGSEYSQFTKILPGDSILELCKKLYTVNVGALHQTLELFDESEIIETVEILNAARNIYCFGQGGGLVMAMELWARFVTVIPNIHCIMDSHFQAMSASILGEEDVIVYLSYSGAVKEMIDTLKLASERKVKVILITHFKKSPGAAYANVTLLCGSKEGPLQSGSIAAKMAILFIIDVLFNEYCRKNGVRCSENLDITANAIAKKLL